MAPHRESARMIVAFQTSSLCRDRYAPTAEPAGKLAGRVLKPTVETVVIRSIGVTRGPRRTRSDSLDQTADADKILHCCGDLSMMNQMPPR